MKINIKKLHSGYILTKDGKESAIENKQTIREVFEYHFIDSILTKLDNSTTTELDISMEINVNPPKVESK